MADQTNKQIKYYFKEDTNQILVSGSDTVAKTNAILELVKDPVTQANSFYDTKIVNYGVDATYVVQNGPEFVSLIENQAISNFSSVSVDNQLQSFPSIPVTGNINGTGATLTIKSTPSLNVGVYDITLVRVNATGSNWTSGETITIPQSTLISAGFQNPTADLVVTLSTNNVNIYSTEIPLKSDQELWVHKGYNTVGGDGDEYRYNPHLHRAYKAYIVVETGSGSPSNPWLPVGNPINTGISNQQGGNLPGKYLEKQIAILGNESGLSPNIITGSFQLYNSSRGIHPLVFTKYTTIAQPPIYGAWFKMYLENQEQLYTNFSFNTSTTPPPGSNKISFDTADVTLATEIYIDNYSPNDIDIFMSPLSSSYSFGKTGGKLKISSNNTNYTQYDIISIDAIGNDYFKVNVTYDEQSSPFTPFTNAAAIDTFFSEVPNYQGQFAQPQTGVIPISPNLPSITFSTPGFYTYTSSVFPIEDGNNVPAVGSTQLGLYADNSYYMIYNARVDVNNGGTVRVTFTSSANIPSYVDIPANFNANIPALVGTLSQTGFTPGPNDPPDFNIDSTYFGEDFTVTINGAAQGTPPIPPDNFAKRWESAYISYSSSLSSSLDGLYVFNQLPQNDVQVTASMFITAWTGSAEGTTYGDTNSEYGTATYDVGEAGDGPTWPTASIRIYTGSYPTFVPTTLDAFVTQSEFKDENIHVNGLAITMSYLIPSQSIGIKDCLSLSLAVSSGSAPSESVENSLVVREYYLEFNTPQGPVIGDGIVPTFVQNAFNGTQGFTNAPDCQPVLNNALGERENRRIQQVDYSTGIYDPVNFQAILSGSAQKSTVPESNYTQLANILPRYIGSRTSAKEVNSIEGLVNGFGTLPVIDYQIAYFAYCDQILDPYPVVNNKILLNLKYLINGAGDALNPLLSPYTGLDVEQSWSEGGLGNIQVNQISGSAQYDQINGLQPILTVAKQPVPILYSQTASNGYLGENESIPLEGNPNFVSSFSQSYMQYGQRIGGSVYDVSKSNNQQINYANLLGGITSSGGNLNSLQVSSSFLNRWGQWYDESAFTLRNDQIGNTIILNESDTANWTGSTFPIPTDGTGGNNATTNPYLGNPGQMFFTIDPVAMSGSGGVNVGELSDNYIATINYTQPSSFPNRFRTQVGEGSSIGNPWGTSTEYGTDRVGDISFSLQAAAGTSQNWQNKPFTFTEEPKIVAYFGNINNQQVDLDGTSTSMPLSQVSTDEGIFNQKYSSGIYRVLIQNKVANDTGRVDDVAYVSFIFKARSNFPLKSGVKYRWSVNLNYLEQNSSVLAADGVTNFWNPTKVPKGYGFVGLSGGTVNDGLPIANPPKGPFVNLEVISSQTEDQTEDNAINYPYWEFSSSNATPPLEFNYTSSLSDTVPPMNGDTGLGSIRFDNSEFNDTNNIYLTETSSAGQIIKPYIDHLNSLSSKGQVIVTNNLGSIVYTGSITNTINASGTSAGNDRRYEIPVTPTVDSDNMFENQSDLTLVFTTGSSDLTPQRNVLLMVSPNGNLTYDKDYYIGYVPYIPSNNNAFPGGQEPTDTAWPRPNISWNVQPGDEIRFVNSETTTRRVTQITTPSEYQEQSGTFQLRLQLDDYIDNGVNIQFFLLRRYLKAYNSILINTQFSYGSLPQLTKWVDSKDTKILNTGIKDSGQPWTATFPSSQSMTEEASGSYVSYTPPLKKADNTPSGFFFPHFPIAEIELNPDETLKQLRDNKLIT